MTVRHLRGQYKQSVLGYAWALMMPLAQMLIMTVRLLDYHPHRAPAWCALRALSLRWPPALELLLELAISPAPTSVVGASSLVTKVYFPREILPASAIFTKVFDLFSLR